jgi:hypothetical protein
MPFDHPLRSLIEDTTQSLSRLSRAAGHEPVSMKVARHHIDNEPVDDRAEMKGDQGVA